MATINNTNVTKRMIDDLNLQIQVDKIPSEIADKIIAVYPLYLTGEVIVRSADVGAAAIYEVPEGKRFALISAWATGGSMEGSDSAVYLGINLLGGNNGQNILQVDFYSGAGVTSDVGGSGSVAISYANPVIFPSGTTFECTAAAGIATGNAGIMGYEIENRG